jgi:hypothetical protein
MLSMLIDLRLAVETLLITLFLRAEMPPPHTCVPTKRRMVLCGQSVDVMVDL